MIPCTWRQLEIFVAAAEDCHFARTAHRLGMSQPAVSAQISAVEAKLGKQLFVRRKGTTPTLSADGAALLRRAKGLLSEGTQLYDMHRARVPEKTLVRLVVGAHLLEDCIRPQLVAFHEAHPDILVQCQLIDNVEKGVQQIKRGAADLLLFSVRDPAALDLHVEVVRRVRFGLYASKQFARYKKAPPKEISTLPFVLPLEGSDPDRMILEELTAADIYCSNVAIRVQYSDTVLSFVKRGYGVGALFETMIDDVDLENGLFQFDVELRPRYRTISRRQSACNAAVRSVEDFLLEILRQERAPSSAAGPLPHPAPRPSGTAGGGDPASVRQADSARG
jgi:DNA-binding transcriptional LysR family regulator